MNKLKRQASLSSASKTSTSTISSASSSNLRRPSIPKKRRIRPVAHYDAQSLPLSLDPLIAARDAIASYSATKQATGASAAHNTNEAGEGLHNHLVSLCPRFINEIGGEWFNEENGVGIVRRSLPKHMRYKVFSHVDNLVYEGDILAEHWSSYSSNASMDPFSRFSGTSWEMSNLSPYPLEFIDYGATYYREYFANQEHHNLFGVDDVLGPVAISIKKEKFDNPAHLTSPYNVPSPKFQYRFIMRTSELHTLRGCVPEEAISASKTAQNKGISYKDVIDFVSPEIQISCLKVAKQERKVVNELLKIDEQELNNRYKIGVLYCAAGQSTEEEMYNNEFGSPEFEEFLEFLGDKVELKGFQNYRAMLDTKTDTTGQYSVYTEFRDCEIMFHVSTLLPFQPQNKQQLMRKRHIGNDIVTLVFQDPGSEAFSAKAIRSHFQHVFIVVRPHKAGSTDEETEYNVAVSRLKDVPYFGPALPEKGKFKKNDAFREFLLTKVINAENAGHKSDKFMQMATRTRQAYLMELAVNSVTQQLVDTGSSGGFGILRGLSRRREKVNLPIHSLVYSPAALVWDGQLLLEKHINKEDSPQPVPLHVKGQDCATVDIILGLSIDSLTIVDYASKLVLLHLPTSCITGWHTESTRINIVFDGTECLSFEMTEDDSEEITTATLEGRLSVVAPHASKAVAAELPLSFLASMSVDSGLVMNVGNQSTIEAGDYIVQVGSLLVCSHGNLFEEIKKAAVKNDDLAQVILIRHVNHQLPPLVHTVKRTGINWESIWSVRPGQMDTPISSEMGSLESAGAPEASREGKSKRELKSKSQSSGHVYKRKMHRFQKRTHSYLQAVDRDVVTLSESGGESDEGSSRNTSPLPLCTLNGDSNEKLSEDEQREPHKEFKESPLSDDKKRYSAPPLSPLATGSGEIPSKDEDGRKGLESGLKKPSLASTRWRTGRVRELTAVFSKEVTPPPLPSVNFKPGDTSTGSKRNSLVNSVEFDESNPSSPKLTPTGSNRFGFSSKHPPLDARKTTTGIPHPRPVGEIGSAHQRPKSLVESSGGRPPQAKAKGPVDGRPLEGQASSLQDVSDATEHREADKFELGSFVKPHHGKEVGKKISVRDRTAKWERISKVPSDQSTGVSAGPSSGSGLPLSPRSSLPIPSGASSISASTRPLRSTVQATTASAGKAPVSRRRSAEDVLSPPATSSTTTMRGHVDSIPERSNAQAVEASVRPVKSNKPKTETAKQSSSGGSSLPSYAHQFTGPPTSQAKHLSLSNRNSTPSFGHASIPENLVSSSDHQLKSKPLQSPLQGNVNNNNNGDKKKKSPSPDGAALTKLKSPPLEPDKNQPPRQLVKPMTLTHPAASPKSHVRSQSLDQGREQPFWKIKQSRDEKNEQGKAPLKKQMSASRIPSVGSSSKIPSGPVAMGDKRRHSSLESSQLKYSHSHFEVSKPVPAATPLSYQPKTSSGQRPPQQIQRPPQQIQRPSQQIQRPPQQIQRPPQQIQHPSQQIQRPPQQIQHPSQQIQHPPQQIQHPSQQIQRPPQQIQHPSQQIQHPPQQIQRPPQQIQHPSQQIQHPPQQIQRPPQQIQQPSQQIQHPPQQIQHPSQQIQHPPQQIQRPPQQIQKVNLAMTVTDSAESNLASDRTSDGGRNESISASSSEYVPPPLPLPPNDSPINMDDLSSASSYESLKDEPKVTFEDEQFGDLQEKYIHLRQELEMERKDKEELTDAMKLMKKELSLLRVMRSPSDV